MLTVGLRGASTLGCSLLLGEEITGHLQLPLISHRVRLEPGERPVGGWCPALGKHKKTETNVSQPSSTTLCPFTVLNMRVQIDLVHSPPQPNHLFSLKTDSFMCCYHVIMCCCSAGSYSISETFTSRQKGWMGRGVQGKRGAVAAVFMGHKTCPSWHWPSSSLVFPCQWFPWKSLEQNSPLEKHICQVMSTPGLLLFLLGCKHDIPHGPGMLTRSSGQSQTGRVKLKKIHGAFCFRLHFGRT